MVLAEIMRLADEGLAINYDVVDQIENGHKQLNPTMPQKTYTVYITPVANGTGHDWLDCQNFDNLETELKWGGVKEAKKHLKKLNR